MKRIALAVSTPFLFHFAAFAQQTSADDSAAVQATVRNYIEAYYTGDARRMEQTLQPHL